MLHGKKIIAVLPAYNAEKTLKVTLDAIPKNVVDEVILVDDASRDNTSSLSRELGITTFTHPKNRGYGGNQKTCYREALKSGADVVVMVHPDFQYDPKYIPELVAPIAEGKIDAMFGSRMLVPANALRGGMPYWKFFANIFLTALENFVLGMRLSEYHSGFRAYSRKILETLPLELNSDDFVFDTEIIAQMRIAGFSVKEIPIATRYFPEASMINFSRSTKYGLEILKVMGRYVLHTAGVWPTLQLQPLIEGHSVRCVICGSDRVQLLYPGTVDLDRYFRTSAYSITESSSGMHGNIYHCASCRTAFVDRTNIADALSQHYRNQSVDQTYLLAEKGRRKTFRRVAKKIRKIFPFSSHAKILDIGCGPGLFLSEARISGFDPYGAEISRESVLFAQHTLKLEKVELVESMAPAEMFPGTEFDAITAFDVLEHLLEPKKFLEAISQKLKPGGVAVFTVPLMHSPGAKILGRRWHALLPTHLTYFSRPALLELARQNELEIRYSRYYLRHLPLHYILERLFKRAIPALYPLTLNIPITFFDEIEVYFQKHIKTQ